MANPPRFQFSIGAMLLVNSLVAVAVATLVALEIPFRLLASLIGTYAVFFGLWALIRGPKLYRNYSDMRRRRQVTADAYKTLAEELRRAKRTKSGAEGSSRDASPFTDS